MSLLFFYSDIKTGALSPEYKNFFPRVPKRWMCSEQRNFLAGGNQDTQAHNHRSHHRRCNHFLADPCQASMIRFQQSRHLQQQHGRQDAQNHQNIQHIPQKNPRHAEINPRQQHNCDRCARKHHSPQCAGILLLPAIPYKRNTKRPQQHRRQRKRSHGGFSVKIHLPIGNGNIFRPQKREVVQAFQSAEEIRADGCRQTGKRNLVGCGIVDRHLVNRTKLERVIEANLIIPHDHRCSGNCWHKIASGTDQPNRKLNLFPEQQILQKYRN